MNADNKENNFFSYENFALTQQVTQERRPALWKPSKSQLVNENRREVQPDGVLDKCLNYECEDILYVEK